MSAVPKQKFMTPEEYLARERLAEFKSEYYNGEIFAMAGASTDHNRIKGNIERRLNEQLEGGPCEPLSGDQRVRVHDTGLYAYPDVVVVCGPQFDPRDSDTIANPVAVVEVLSDSTERYDRRIKTRLYQAIPSLREVFLVAQDEPMVERFARQPDDSWNYTAVTDLDGFMEFTSVPVRIPLTEVYRRVEFAEPPAE